MANQNRAAGDGNAQKKQMGQFLGFAINFCTVFSLIFMMVLLLIINLNGGTQAGVANTAQSLQQICQNLNAQTNPGSGTDAESSMMMQLNDLQENQ